MSAPPSPLQQTQLTVTILSAATFMSGAALRLCDGLLPRLGEDLQVTAGTAGQVVTVFALAYSLLQLLFGPIGDRVGKARVIVSAVAGCSVFAMAAAIAPGFVPLLGARVFWGAASAGVIPLTLAWIGDSVPLHERQPMLARLLFGTLTGMSFGQLAGGLFADSAWGWRGAFASMGVAYALVALLLLRRFRSTGWGPAAATGARVALHRQWAMVLGSGWSRWVLVAALVEGAMLLGPLAYMPALLHQRFGLRLTHAAAMLALFAVGGLLYAVLARQLVQRLGQRRMVIAGGLLMAVGCLGWLLSPVAWTAAPVALLVGFGLYLYHGTLQTHATQMAPAARGTAVALFAAFLFTGQALGAALAGWAFDVLGAGWMLVPPALALPAIALAYARAMDRHEAIAAGR